MAQAKQKPVKGNIKFRVQAGKATPAPPVGSMLGAHGVNMMDFINAFNEQTRELGDQLLSVKVKIFEDRTFVFTYKGETTANLTRVFESLRDPLVELIGKIKDSPHKTPASILERKYPAAAQEKLARLAATAVGFDFQAGRLDVSVHPFCSGLGPGDTRMTTRYDESYFSDAFFGVLHETGHGLYNQGLKTEHYGTPLGSAVSLGIHESQSAPY